jgi:serine/threonine protein kinase
VHRDIKPENIMLRRRDLIVKVLDFGLAKPAGAELARPDQAVDTEVGTRVLVHTEPGRLMGYTWSHAITNVPLSYDSGTTDPFNYDLDRGDANLDRRQMFVANAVVVFPSFKKFSMVGNRISSLESQPVREVLVGPNL